MKWIHFNPITSNQINASGISKSPQVGSPKFQSSLNYITVHQASYQKVPIMQVAPYEISILQIAR